VDDWGTQVPQDIPQAGPRETLGRGQARLGEVPPCQEGKGVCEQTVWNQGQYVNTASFWKVAIFHSGGGEGGQLGGLSQMLRHLDGEASHQTRPHRCHDGEG
jgi:hypothetical protein